MREFRSVALLMYFGLAYGTHFYGNSSSISNSSTQVSGSGGCSSRLTEYHTPQVMSSEAGSSYIGTTGVGAYVAAGIGVSSSPDKSSPTASETLSHSSLLGQASSENAFTQLFRSRTNAKDNATVSGSGARHAVTDLPTYTAFNTSTPHYQVTAVHTFVYTSSIVRSAGASTSLPLLGTGSSGSAVLGSLSKNTSRASNGVHYSTGSAASGVLYGTGTGVGSGNRTNATLASTGLGYSYADACNQASISWTKKFMTEGYITASEYYPSLLTAAPPAADVYTLCDGIPRMKANITTQERPFASLQQLVQWKAMPTSPPVCSIQPSDCASLLLSYSSKHQVPASASLGPIHTSYEPYILDDFPRCQTNTVPCGTPGADCALSGTGIQLFYWPQTWAGGYCGNHKEIVTLGPTISGKPNTATWKNYTLTSPTVYVKYDSISAHDICGNNFGPTLTGGLIALPSESVFSKVPYFMTNMPWDGPSGLIYVGREVGISNAVLSGWPGINPDYGDAGVPVTYPDLDPETVPAIPYFQREMLGGDQWCYYGGCPTMVPWNYFPRLQVPDQARSLATEWLSCTLAWGAMDDPPSALAPVSAIAKPTVPAGNSPTTSASPRVTAVQVTETHPPKPHTTSTKNKHSDDPTQKSASPQGPSPTKPRTGHEIKPHAPHVHSDVPLLAQSHSPGQTTRALGSPRAKPHGNGVSVVVISKPNHVPIGSATLTADSSSQYIIRSKTLKPGHSGIVVSGTSYSIDPSGNSVFVNGSPSPLPKPITEVVVDGHTVEPGSSATVISGTSYSIDPSGRSIYVNGSPSPVPSTAAVRNKGQDGPNQFSEAIITFGDQVVTAIEESGIAGTKDVYFVGSVTLQADGPMKTLNGQTVSAVSGGLVIDRKAAQAVFTVGSSTYTAVETTNARGQTVAEIVHETTLANGQTQIAADTYTLTQGGSAMTTEGETIKFMSSGLAIHSGGSATTVPFSDIAVTTTVAFSALRSRETILAISGTPLLFSERVVGSGATQITEYIHGSLTLSETIFGHGTERQTEFVGAAPATSEATFTAGGHAITAVELPGYIVLEGASSTATVRDGSVITFEGQTLSVISGGAAVVVSGETILLSTATASASNAAGTVTAQPSIVPAAAVSNSLAGSPSSTSTSGTASTSSLSTAVLLIFFTTLLVLL